MTRESGNTEQVRLIEEATPSYQGMLTGRLVREIGKLSERTSGRRGDLGQLDALAWGRYYLADHFLRAPSRMHVWLGEQLDQLQENRGTKINVIGPRGGAKSTIGTLCYVLRVAIEGAEPYIWIVSDTKHQAQTHLENVKIELEENDLLASAPTASVTSRKFFSRNGSKIALQFDFVNVLKSPATMQWMTEGLIEERI